MKKIRDKSCYSRNQRRANKRSKDAKRRMKRNGSAGASHGKPRPIIAPEDSSKVVTVVAPNVLSLAQNPEETINFINKIIAADVPKCRINLDLNSVEEVTLDAILLLVSKIKSRGFQRCSSIGGKEPKNQQVKEFLARSGFYSHFEKKPVSYKEQDNNGYLKRREGKKVREDVAQELIHYANQKLFNELHRSNKGVYRVLIECMANTRDHASLNNKEQESWWLAVYHDKEKRKVYFAFLDNGVGLFNSDRLQGFIKSFASMMGVYNRISLLREMLDGKVASTTGIPYRGKGMPAIYTAMQRGFFTNLKIVSNNVVFDAASRDGRLISQEFKGTSYTWEVGI